MIASGENAYEGAAETSSRRPRPVPLSALPSPISIDSPSAYTARNRFSLIAGSISSLFGAKRSSVVSSLTEEEPPSTGRRPISLSTGRDRTSYAGQPLVGEDVYREAFLSGIPEGDRRDRQESSGETQESGRSGRKELSEGVLSEEDGSGETFGVKNGRGQRARVVTPANRGGEKMRTGSTGSAARVGEFGEVIPVESGNEVLRTPGDMRKTVSVGDLLFRRQTLPLSLARMFPPEISPHFSFQVRRTLQPKHPVKRPRYKPTARSLHLTTRHPYRKRR